MKVILNPEYEAAELELKMLPDSAFENDWNIRFHDTPEVLKAFEDQDWDALRRMAIAPYILQP